MAATPISWTRRRLMPTCCLIMFSSVPVFGFCFQPHPSAACDFLNSDAVFTGKVISVRTVTAGGFINGWYYRLHVLRLLRGPHTKVIEVYTANDSGRYPLDPNRKYLIFATKRKGRFFIGNCDDNAPLSQAKALIRKIQGIKIPQDGIIEGRVILHYVDSGIGVPGIKVIVGGKGAKYRLTTNRQGWFRVHVPPGPYWIKVEPTPAHPIKAYDLNYGGNPNNFGVEAGRCAGFEFVANSLYNY